MTAINIGLSERQVVIVSDELVSGGSAPAMTSKLVPLVHLGVVVGVTGHADMLPFVVASLLCGAPPGTGLLDLVDILPESLRAIATKRGYTRRTTVFVVGVTGPDTVAAFYFSSAFDFEARQLPPGVWLTPGLDDPPSDVEPGPPDEAAPPAPTVVDPSPPPRRSFGDCCSIAVDAMNEQRRRYPDSIGGRRFAVHVTPERFNVSWLDEFPDAP